MQLLFTPAWQVLTKTQANAKSLSRKVKTSQSSELNDCLIAQFAGIETRNEPKPRSQPRAQPRSQPRLQPRSQPRSQPKGDFRLGLRDWDFDSLGFDVNQLVTICLDIFVELEVDLVLDVSRLSLVAFVQDVQKIYHDIPFHNFHHAVSVFHTTYMALTAGDECWSPTETTSALLAAPCHDLEHRGLNNAQTCKALQWSKCPRESSLSTNVPRHPGP